MLLMGRVAEFLALFFADKKNLKKSLAKNKKFVLCNTFKNAW